MYKFIDLDTGLPALLNKVKTWVTSKLSAKQDALVSGTNIKTVNNESLLGGGNITIQGEKGDTGNCTITGDGGNIVTLIVNDLTTGGAGNILSAEQGKVLNDKTRLNIGSYNQAWVYSQSRNNETFCWVLNDTIDGDTIRKPIYHIGDGTFIDAVGAAVSIASVAPAVPVFSIESGSTVGKNTPLNVTFEAGAILHYTVNGGNMQTDTLSPAVINITSSTTVEAWCENAAGTSAHRIASYSISGPADPVFSEDSGEVEYGTVLSISFAAGATLHYKVGNAAWATTSNTPLQLSIESAVTIQAYVDDGTEVSETVSRSYTIAAPDAPEFSVNSGTVVYGTDVEISWESGTLHYIINSGTEQTASSSPLTIKIQDPATIEAWAQSGQVQSTHVTRSYAMAPKSLKITASSATTVTINGNTYNLAAGENTLAMSTVDSGGNDEIASMSFTDKTLITVFDGGGATFTGTAFTFFSGATNLVSITNFRNTASMTSFSFVNCTKLATLDTSCWVPFTITAASIFQKVKIPEIDVSMVSFNNVSTDSMFRTLGSTTTIKIGQFDNSNRISAMFTETTRITKFYCTTTTPPSMKSSSLDWVSAQLMNKNPNCTIYVPMSAVNTYKADTYWGAYADHIVGYE